MQARVWPASRPSPHPPPRTSSLGPCWRSARERRPPYDLKHPCSPRAWANYFWSVQHSALYAEPEPPRPSRLRQPKPGASRAAAGGRRSPHPPRKAACGRLARLGAEPTGQISRKPAPDPGPAQALFLRPAASGEARRRPSFEAHHRELRRSYEVTPHIHAAMDVRRSLPARRLAPRRPHRP